MADDASNQGGIIRMAEQPSFDDIYKALKGLGDRIVAQIRAQGWSTAQALSTVTYQGPPLSAEQVQRELQVAADRIRSRQDAGEDLTDLENAFLDTLPARCNAVSVQHAANDVDAIFGQALEVANSVFRNIGPAPFPAPKVDWEELKDERHLLPRDLARRLRALEARLSELEPRSDLIAGKVADIENAHTAAEQLPEDLATLAEKGKELEDLMSKAREQAEKAGEIEVEVGNCLKRVQEAEGSANTTFKTRSDLAALMLSKSEQALRGATSAGLATAFRSRQQALARSGIAWTVGLVIALLVALAVGWDRVTALRDVLNGSKSTAVIIANAVLAVCGIGAPAWFAWLSTRQIGTTFRLSEDYAFKASVAQAYEGYRAEAVEIDPELQARLFASALDRLDEAPIRLLDAVSHNSPLAEILGNAALRKALESVPGIADKIMALIPTKGGAAVVAAPAAAAAVITGLAKDQVKTTGD